ncbi:hypothetical protein P5G51_004450 [Virgibacillus sp. 179-BFC.A HS]|uniref:Uncharacterized protein n=1 Tax=Tigheibacillus jepli TaxID=3035914 RepID=A0ABU5CGR2_9BACI|nr:hypothetical protein [Virgibacillus sp. 179-BFC.A HS]MDY0404753.1 hypothetical protein [Virgibacillus sp. 179-BFC.A HS]
MRRENDGTRGAHIMEEMQSKRVGILFIAVNERQNEKEMREKCCSLE